MTTHFDMSIASGQTLDLAHPEYPVEQLASSKSTQFQRGFADMPMWVRGSVPRVSAEPVAHDLIGRGAHLCPTGA